MNRKVDFVFHNSLRASKNKAGVQRACWRVSLHWAPMWTAGGPEWPQEAGPSAVARGAPGLSILGLRRIAEALVYLSVKWPELVRIALWGPGKAALSLQDSASAGRPCGPAERLPALAVPRPRKCKSSSRSGSASWRGRPAEEAPNVTEHRKPVCLPPPALPPGGYLPSRLLQLPALLWAVCKGLAKHHPP